MPNNSDLMKRRQQAVAPGVGSMHTVYCDHAKNAELWDVEGKRYIDFAGGIAVLNTGHLHPKVKAAAAAALEKMSHVCFQVTPYESYVAVAERLNALVPGDSPKKTLLLTTGAEAVENSVKIARAYTGRTATIAFSGGFHGRTFFALALTGKVSPYKAAFGPLPAEVYHAPYPIEYHGVSVDDALAEMDRLFHSDVDPSRVAAMIIEPVLGEGGFYAAPPAFLQALRKLCDDHGIVLIVDEIQTGFGRTGRMFAVEYAGIEPDLMTFAKSLAGGFPLSAVTGKASIIDAVNPGGLGGTYGGSPLACASALAAMDVIEEEKLVERSLRIGDLIDRRLRALANEPAGACIGDIRHLGAMAAMELVSDRATRAPDAALTKALTQKAAEKGLVLLSCGVRGNVIRFLAPLTASDELVNEGLDILRESLIELRG
ncbi:MAG: 4-aminobutyrate--2-oxoglutarate transaminase [Myxococcales bacterium]|nr:4-aminobutyrate--2-oxoglutarate transaminase [Myxococcales bacterium]